MNTWLKYWAFVRVGVVRGVSERGELYGRLLFLPIILGVFYELWSAVGETGMPTSAAPHDLVWYLAATEWIVLSPALIYVDVQEDIRRGDIACVLPRPVSYLGSMFCQGVGLLVVRAPVLGLGLFACALAYTHELPEPSALLWVISFGLAAMAFINACYVLLGLTAFWLDDVTPLYWIWQKSLFVLGGLMVPLELYPDWFRALGAFTPFPSLLSGPASALTTHVTAPFAITLATHLLSWSLGLTVVGAVLFAHATRRLQLTGG
ncbi:MAG TPA: ABC-2 family transporter protein [Polyangiales bacterium]|nr:ABC-2 family transporter protein [Polyangiales bacterium]